MKQILFITTRFPYPPNSGRAKTLMQYLEFLNRDNIELHLLSFVTRSEPDLPARGASLKQACPAVRSIDHLPLPGIVPALVRSVWQSLIRRRSSIQECFYFSQQADRTIRSAIDHLQPDLIFCDMHRTAQYIAGRNVGGAFTVFDMDDMLSERYRELLVTDVDALGAFAANLPRWASVLANGLFRKPLLRCEITRIQASELRYARTFERTILVSPRECALFSGLAGVASIYAILPAAMIDHTGHQPHTVSISFMGLLNYSPNEKGLLRFIKDIYPTLLSSFPELVFYIIGANPTPEIIKAAAAYPGRIILTGFVDDYRTIVRDTDVFVAPIDTGSGINVKIIDALALGMPVVTTPIGSDGLPITDGENIMVAESDQLFSQCVVRLLSDRQLRERLSAGARAYIAAHHDYETIRRQFLAVLDIPSTEDRV